MNINEGELEPKYPSYAFSPIAGGFHFKSNRDNPDTKFNEFGTITIDPGWVKQHIIGVELPIVNKIYWMNRKMVNPLCSALRDLLNEGYGRFIRTVDGVWVPRHIKSDLGRKLSNHCWGTAVDINAADNPVLKEGNQHPHVVATFKKWGLRWGGDWKNRDDMHFEL